MNRIKQHRRAGTRSSTKNKSWRGYRFADERFSTGVRLEKFRTSKSAGEIFFTGRLSNRHCFGSSGGRNNDPRVSAVHFRLAGRV
jgi:hypothetical protein